MSRDQRPYAQWPKPKGAVNAPQVVLGVLVRSESGGWAVDDGPGAEAEASLVASPNGGLGADDSMPPGGRIRAQRTRTIGML